jgi:hypothetical protein
VLGEGFLSDQIEDPEIFDGEEDGEEGIGVLRRWSECRSGTGVIRLALGCAGLQRLDVEVARHETVPWHPTAGELRGAITGGVTRWERGWGNPFLRRESGRAVLVRQGRSPRQHFPAMT